MTGLEAWRIWGLANGMETLVQRRGQLMTTNLPVMTYVSQRGFRRPNLGFES